MGRLLTPGERVLRSRIAAHTRWAHEVDRCAATAPARNAFETRFEREVDSDGVLPETERIRRAESARNAYFARLALKSAQARRRREQARQTEHRRGRGTHIPPLKFRLERFNAAKRCAFRSPRLCVPGVQRAKARRLERKRRASCTGLMLRRNPACRLRSTCGVWSNWLPAKLTAKRTDFGDHGLANTDAPGSLACRDERKRPSTDDPARIRKPTLVAEFPEHPTP
jgi:hypothetical protein